MGASAACRHEAGVAAAVLMAAPAAPPELPQPLACELERCNSSVPAMLAGQRSGPLHVSLPPLPPWQAHITLYPPGYVHQGQQQQQQPQPPPMVTPPPPPPLDLQQQWGLVPPAFLAHPPLQPTLSSFPSHASLQQPWPPSGRALRAPSFLRSDAPVADRANCTSAFADDGDGTCAESSGRGGGCDSQDNCQGCRGIARLCGAPPPLPLPAWMLPEGGGPEGCSPSGSWGSGPMPQPGMQRPPKVMCGVGGHQRLHPQPQHQDHNHMLEDHLGGAQCTQHTQPAQRGGRQQEQGLAQGDQGRAPAHVPAPIPLPSASLPPSLVLAKLGWLLEVAPLEALRVIRYVALLALRQSLSLSPS